MQQPGKNINISGSITLVRSLMRDGLLDELQIQPFPVVGGSGMRLFADSGTRYASSSPTAARSAHMSSTGRRWRTSMTSTATRSPPRA
jgi:dihydrofolate reductase